MSKKTNGPRKDAVADGSGEGMALPVAVEAQPTGPEIMDRMQETVTLNRFMERNPVTMTREDFKALLEIQRRDRALFIGKKA